MAGSRSSASRRCPDGGTASGARARGKRSTRLPARSNGYTPSRAPRDTSLLVREPFEIGSWALLADQRRYGIEPRALLADCDAGGCIVFFRRCVRSQGCLAVTISRAYDRLQFGRPAETELVRRSAQVRCF